MLVRHRPSDENNELTSQLVECYRDVFADGPWNEWMKCAKCQSFWGKKDAAILTASDFKHCDEPVVDFWPRWQVIQDLRHEVTAQASCWLALDGHQVVGFCWGYPISMGTLQSKLGLALNIDSMSSSNKMVAYQDEVGVLKSHRNQKIAKAMVLRRLQDFLSLGLDIGLVRTRQFPEPSLTFLWYTEKLGFEIVARYPNDDGLVVLARPLAGLYELLIK